MRRILTAISILGFALSATAHEDVTIEAFNAAFGIDLETAEVTSETVAPGIHVLFGAGGNVLASIGDQGVFLVDSQFPQMVPRILEKVSELGGNEINFMVNTHWHFDHADGNSLLAQMGVIIVSQINSRRMMAGQHSIDMVGLIVSQPPYPKGALPVITYTDQMQVHFNNERIDLMHFGPAHTTGDTAVLFRGSNVVHMGDVTNPGYPFIDAGNGGDLDGMILFNKKVLNELNEDSIVVPGHGSVMSYADMAAYTLMLETVRDRINRLIDAGMSLEQVLAAKPTAEFDAKYGLWGGPERLINRAYMSLAR